MKKAYIFIYGEPATRESVKAILDAMPEVSHWRCDIPNAFYIISENSAREIAKSYSLQRSNSGRFLIAEINGQNKEGWLPSASWYLINRKEYKPKTGSS